MTLRAVIYARYSSDQQYAASIEDQIPLCRERASRAGWQIVGSYEDAATSGASLMRPGIQRLQQDARERRFDVVLSEALDRLSRNQADIAALYQNLTFAGTAIETLAEGRIDEMQIGLKGTMNALFLKNLAAKIRRGLRGRVEAGKSGGGNAFGYTVLRSLTEDGEIKRGDREINPEEVAIVRRIFQSYAGTIDVLEGRSGRRLRSEPERARIAAESLVSGARVSDVARRHAVTRWQIYDWRKKLASGQLALTAETASEPMFAALVVAPPSAPVTGPRDGSVRSEAKKTIGIPASQPLEQELGPREIRRGGHVRRS